MRTIAAGLPQKRPRLYLPSAGHPPSIIGQSDAINRLVGQLQRLAGLDARVLITGESGVGKELVASYIHSISRRASSPFVTVNCAGIPEGLLESELFGHVRGSFTGAYRDKPGKFEMADTGTLFLDEVGEMTPRMQGLLLRVIETGEVQKVGADQTNTRIDCRVIAATNRHLPDLVKQGSFREDLFYRLDVVHVVVPPLRERGTDIRLLSEYFLERLNQELGVSCEFAPDALDLLERYSWPGNVRQLQNVVQRLMINSRTGHIAAPDVTAELNVDVPEPSTPAPRERRVAVAGALYQRLLDGQSFWDVVYAPFLRHEITKADLREVIRIGLVASRGNYRSLLKLFHVDRGHYKRFMNFLRKHDCCLPFRDFR